MDLPNSLFSAANVAGYRPLLRRADCEPRAVPAAPRAGRPQTAREPAPSARLTGGVAVRNRTLTASAAYRVPRVRQPTGGWSEVRRDIHAGGKKKNGVDANDRKATTGGAPAAVGSLSSRRSLSRINIRLDRASQTRPHGVSRRTCLPRRSFSGSNLKPVGTRARSRNSRQSDYQVVTFPTTSSSDGCRAFLAEFSSEAICICRHAA